MRTRYTPYITGEKVRMVFMFQVASFWPSWESFYKACVMDDEIDVRLIYVNRSSVEKVQTTSAQEFLDNRELSYIMIDQFDFNKFKPHIVLFQQPYDISYRIPNDLSIHFQRMGARIVYIPYGIEISDTEDARFAHFHTFVVRNSWKIYTLSDKMKEDYQEHCYNRHSVRALGHPRFDFYKEHGHLPLTINVKEKSLGRKIILWKAHFPKLILEGSKYYQVTPYITEYIKFAKELHAYKDLFFVFMPHPMFFSMTIDVQLRKEADDLIEILKTIDNVYIDLADDYRDSLINADAIIIDRSGIMIEAAVVNVPILYMTNPDFTEKLTEAVLPLVETYYQGNSYTDMLNFLNKDIYKDIKKEIRIKALHKCIPYLDGACGRRIKEDIINSLKAEVYKHDSKIRLVLFGVGQVCNFYLENTRIFSEDKCEIVAFSDNSSVKWGQKSHGVEIIEPIKLREYEFDFLVVMTEQYFMDIKKKLVYEINLDDSKIIELDKFVALLTEDCL